MKHKQDKTKDSTTEVTNVLQTDNPEYIRLVSHISNVWEGAKGKAALAVNTDVTLLRFRTSNAAKKTVKRSIRSNYFYSI